MTHWAFTWFDISHVEGNVHWLAVTQGLGKCNTHTSVHMITQMVCDGKLAKMIHNKIISKQIGSQKYKYSCDLAIICRHIPSTLNIVRVFVDFAPSLFVHLSASTLQNYCGCILAAFMILNEKRVSNYPSCERGILSSKSICSLSRLPSLVHRWNDLRHCPLKI